MTDPKLVEELQAQLDETRSRLQQLIGGNDTRGSALSRFATLTGMPPLKGITQRGRDPETARFTLRFADGKEVRIGTVKILWSRAEFSKVLAVAIGRIPNPCKPGDWTSAVGSLFAYVVEVEEAPDEAYEDSVRDWLGTYTNRTSSDQQEAAPRRLPFTTDDELFVNAGDLAKYVRREYSENVRLPELRQALTDLGFQQTAVSFTRGRADGKSRTSASYYRAPLRHLDLPDLS